MLSPQHRRALHANLSTVERDLDAIEDVLDGRRDSRTLARFEDGLTPDEVAGLRQWLASMREGIRCARERLRLEPRSESVKGVINGHLSHIGLALEESRPSGLRGYGTFAPDQEALLEEVAFDLLARLSGVGASADPSRSLP